MNHELEKDINKFREIARKNEENYKLKKKTKLKKNQEDLIQKFEEENIYDLCLYAIAKNRNKKNPQRWVYVFDVSKFYNRAYFYNIDGDKLLNIYLKEKGLTIKFKSSFYNPVDLLFDSWKECVYVLDYSVEKCIIL